MSNRYQALQWDSDLFGINVARITEPDLTPEQVSAILSDLQSQGFKLVYWSSNKQYDASQLDRSKGYLADIKTTFSIDLRTLQNHHQYRDQYRGIVERYTNEMLLADLEQLAIDSAEYSRFTVDSNFPPEKCAALYKTWIRSSLAKQIATEVLVIRESKRVVAMVTLGEKDGQGDIGLIAVAKEFRRRSYGEILVRAAQQWFASQSYQMARVVTQAANTPACNLYRKCDFTVAKTEYFYHFWL